MYSEMGRRTVMVTEQETSKKEGVAVETVLFPGWPGEMGVVSTATPFFLPTGTHTDLFFQTQNPFSQ